MIIKGGMMADKISVDEFIDSPLKMGKDGKLYGPPIIAAHPFPKPEMRDDAIQINRTGDNGPLAVESEG